MRTGSLALLVAVLATERIPAQSSPLFGGAQFTMASFGTDAAASDVNGDGKMDLLMLRNPDLLYVSLGDGHGNLGVPLTYNCPSGVGFDVGNVNNDAFPDVVVATSNGSAHVMINNFSGGFPTITDIGLGGATDITLADVSGDGKLDIVGPNSGTTFMGTEVKVSINNGSGGFGVAMPFTVGIGPTRAVVADFTLDGKADIATANRTSNNVSLLAGNGIGGFTSGGTFAVGTMPLGLAVGDINIDGRPDIVTANGGSDNLSVLLGNAASTFLPSTTVTAGDEPASVAIADINADGKPDALVANATSNTATVHFGFGAAGGLGSPSAFPVGQTPRSIFARDMNGDGYQDILAANHGGSTVSGSGSILLGNNAGGFGAPSRFHVGDQPYDVAVAYVDGDGHLDMVTADGGATISVLLGNGAGGFGQAVTYSTGSTARGITLGDVSGDGRPDAVVMHFFSNTISVLINNGSGGFGAPTTYSIGGGNHALEIELATMDANSSLDLVVLTDDDFEAATVLKNLGAGTFGTPIIAATQNVAASPQAMAVADIDGDSDNDVALANSNTVGLLKGNGNGTLTQGGVISMAVGGDLAVVDLDGDLDADLVGVVQGVPSGVAVALGTGGGSFGAATIYGNVTSARGFGIGDVNNDGKLDVAATVPDDFATYAPTLIYWLGNGLGAFTLVTPRFPIAPEASSLAIADFTEDGLDDISITASLTDEVLLHIAERAIDPWTNLGFPLAGTFGEPTLTGNGTLEPGSRYVLTLNNAYPLHQAFLVFGFATLYGHYKGGTLVPDPNPPGQTLGPFPVNGLGQIIIDTTWPSTAPPGLRLYHQYWISDPAGPSNFSASNGLAGTTP